MQTDLEPSDDALAGLTRATTEAKNLGYSYIHTDHLLLGMLSQPKSIASKIFKGLGVGFTDVYDGAKNLTTPELADDSKPIFY